MSEISMVSALRRAGSTALRDMRSEAKKRIRARKALKAGAVAKTLHISRPAKVVPDITSEWALNVTGGVLRASDYPYRQTKKGVSVRINKTKRSILRSAFVATMSNGHKGVFLRRGKERLPIKEPVASRPVDALRHPGEAEAVGERGAQSFMATFKRLAPGAYEMLPRTKGRIE